VTVEPIVHELSPSCTPEVAFEAWRRDWPVLLRRCTGLAER
jgi:hypothetical protein